MIGGMMKTFYLDMDTVLYEMSYNNIVMLGATLPEYGNEKEKNAISADDPKNNFMIERLLQN